MKIVFAAFGLIIIYIIFVPIANILISVNFGELLKNFGDSEVINSVFLTLRASLWATFFAFIFGVPLAYLLAKEKFFGKRLIEGIIDLPVIIPHTAAGIALLMVIGRDSLLFKLSSLKLVGTEAAISLGMFFVSVPFLVNAAKEGFKAVDRRFEKTALTLGATPLKAFLTISFPLAKKSIVSGMLMMWGRGISEFGAVVILAYYPKTASVLIFERFQNFGLKYAVPVTVILILISLTIFIIVRYFTEK
jgi:molybdate/tungstate transport system permease protein